MLLTRILNPTRNTVPKVFYLISWYLLTLSIQSCSDKNDELVTLFVSSNPGNGANPVSILITPTVAFDGPVLLSSAQDGALKFTNSRGNDVSGNIGYNDTNYSLTFFPVTPLAYGETYSLNWANLVDRSGSLTQGTKSFWFKTFKNPLARSNFYTGGVISSYELHTTDDKGRITRTVSYDATDTITGYSEQSYDTRGNLLTVTDFSDAGIDTIWFNTDDTVQNYTINTYDTNNNLTNYLAATGGGTVIEHYDSIFDANNLETRRISYTDLAKAVIASYSDYIYDTLRIENIEKIVRYSTGGNGIIEDGAGDDTILSYEYFTYNVSSLLHQKALFSGPGPDSTWDLDGGKDSVSSYTTYQYSGNQIRLLTNFSDDGDGIVNSTDTVTSYEHSTYNDANELIQFYTASGVGADGNVDSPTYVDDPISLFETYTTNALGFKNRTLRHAGPGIDGDWFAVSDNPIGNFLNFNYDADGNRINFDTWSAGGDFIENTGDDELLEDNAFDTTQ